jgi:dihydroorotase-like cyclic amidohydrolase
MERYNLVVKNGRLVMPKVGVLKADIGISNGRIVDIAEDISPERSSDVVDASNKFIFPGAIDSHFHVGLFRPFKDDARSESGSAASGGVTTVLSFFRSGPRHHLDKTGPYKEIFPELLEVSRDSYLVDYSYHVAPMLRIHLDEIEWLVRDMGVSQFKYFVMYRALDLTGSSTAASYLGVDEPLDMGFLYEIMEKVAEANKSVKEYGVVRLAIHCEDPDIIRVFTRKVMKKGSSGNLTRDYHDARPGFAEKVAIHQIGLMANETGCPITILHLTSKEAVEAAREVSRLYPHLDVLKEATLHHLSLSYKNDYGLYGKVNPPIRGPEDIRHLWAAISQGEISSIISDHACAPKELKKGDIWTAWPGFGGTSLMFPVMISEGYYRRGLSLQKIAELTSYNTAIGHNLFPKKGALMVGSDADLAIIDLEKEQVVSKDSLFSAQEYTPFEGLKLRGWPVCTILRGRVIYQNGTLKGQPGYGEYVKRPVLLHYRQEE